MRLLLDTSGLLHLAAGTLPAAAATALRTAAAAIVSPVVPWELAIKVKAGKLLLPMPPLDYVMQLVRRHRLSFAADGLDAPLLCAAADLPLIHRDPLDRIIVATAVRDQLTILTADRTIPRYPVTTLW